MPPDLGNIPQSSAIRGYIWRPSSASSAGELGPMWANLGRGWRPNSAKRSWNRPNSKQRPRTSDEFDWKFEAMCPRCYLQSVTLRRVAVQMLILLWPDAILARDRPNLWRSLKSARFRPHGAPNSPDWGTWWRPAQHWASTPHVWSSTARTLAESPAMIALGPYLFQPGPNQGARGPNLAKTAPNSAETSLSLV